MDDAASTGRLLAAATSISMDACAGQVADALAADGVRAVLLKGASITRWLYHDGYVRPSADIDLLVAPDMLDAAGAVLSQLGYSPGERGQLYVLALAGITADESPHSLEWDRPRWPQVDLHRTLHGVQASPERCWEVLSSHLTSLGVGGTTVEVLAPVALALHVVLHAVSSGTDNPKAMEDLARVVDAPSVVDWKAVLELATELGALTAFGIGLRLLGKGREIAEALAVPDLPSVDLVLRASSTRRQALPFEHLAAAQGLNAKVRIAALVLVPSREFMRLWLPHARGGGGGLAAGYVYRCWWVSRHAPRALRDWRLARRRVAARQAVHADRRRS